MEEKKRNGKKNEMQRKAQSEAEREREEERPCTAKIDEQNLGR